LERRGARCEWRAQDLVHDQRTAESEYGNLVLVKIALFIVMLGFGAMNRYWLTPRLLAANVPAGESTRALPPLCVAVSFEIVLGFVVIGVVAVLGRLPPPGHMHHVRP
jgi:putative copper resistance protein D